MLFADCIEKGKAIFDGGSRYLGDIQAMLNVVGREDLENALKYPAKYQNLIVRVGGFSAKFVDLDPDIQQEILAKTLY